MTRSEEQAHEVAASLPHAILTYVAMVVGEGEAERIRVAAGERRSLAELAKPGAWATMATTLAIAAAAAEATRDPAIGRRGGEMLFRTHLRAGIAEVFLAEGTVAAALERVVDASSRMTVGRIMRIVDRGDDAMVVEEAYGDGVAPHRLFCDFAAGYWANIPTLFGADGYAAKVSCRAEGDERCLTRVAWTAPASPGDLPDRAREGRDQFYARFEELQAMAAELAAADDVATVLDLVVDRAGTAVLAPQFLLVVSLGEHDELRVHHRGFPDDAAARLAADRILGGGPTPSTLVPSTSPRPAGASAGSPPSTRRAPRAETSTAD